MWRLFLWIIYLDQSFEQSILWKVPSLSRCPFFFTKIYIDSLSKNKAANNGRKSLFFLFGFTKYVTIRNIIQCRHFFQFECRVEGIAQTIIAILGIFGNLVASFILSRREMRNAFNLVSTVQLMILNVINIYRLPINVKWIGQW